MAELICPLLLMTIQGDRLQSPDKRISNCLKDECAWWDGDTGQCAISALVDGVFKRDTKRFRKY